MRLSRRQEGVVFLPPTSEPSILFWWVVGSDHVPVTRSVAALDTGSISQKKNEGPKGPGRSSRTIQSWNQESGRASQSREVDQPDRRPAAAHRAE